MREVREIQNMMSWQGIDWSRSINIRPRWIDATVAALLSNLMEGQLEGFTWNLDTEPGESLLEYLIVSQPTISSVGLRMMGSETQNTLYFQPYLTAFTTLKSLDLRFNSRQWPVYAIPDILAANQQALERFALSFYFRSGAFSYNISNLLEDSYGEWKIKNLGKTIQLKKLTSVRLESNAETLAFLRNHKLVEREQIEHLDVWIRGRDITIVFAGTTARPGGGDLHNCFSNLKRLHVRLSEVMQHERLSQWDDRYINYLEHYIGAFDLLEELTIEGLWEKFDLKEIKLSKATLRTVELQIKSHGVFYLLEELCAWSTGFDNLRRITIRDTSAVVVRNIDGSFTRTPHGFALLTLIHSCKRCQVSPR
ncbi:hypothetical protein TWF281_008679 [Arthrobotrys megalospora]